MTATPIEKAIAEIENLDQCTETTKIGELSHETIELLISLLRTDPQAAAALEALELLEKKFEKADRRYPYRIYPGEHEILRRALRPATQTQGDENG